MSEKLTQKDLDAFSELAKSADGVEDLATLREMVAEDYGDGEKKVYVEVADGTVAEIPVTEVGAEEYAASKKGREAMAVAAVRDSARAVEDWRFPKQ